MSLSDTISRFAGNTQDLTDKAARKAQRGLNGAKDMADDASDAVSDKMDSVRDNAGPALDKAARRAQDVATQGLQAAGRAAQQLRDGVVDLADGAAAYTKKNPMKAVMIAAASGAVIFGLVRAFSAPRD
jgi:X-X-X-Leu-X-X-Gly heptad repeat protein